MNIHTTHWMICAALMTGACGPKPSDPPPPAASAVQEQNPAPPHADHAANAPLAVELPAVPAGAKVSFVEPAEGAALQGALENGKIAVPVKMGVEGIALKPAGAVEAGSGHHHILIDAEPVAAGTVIPADDQHVHFGKAQTDAQLWLTPGPHKLSLQFADGIHRSYGPQLSATINITVAPAGSVGAAAAGPAAQGANAVPAEPPAGAVKTPAPKAADAKHKH